MPEEEALYSTEPLDPRLQRGAAAHTSMTGNRDAARARALGTRMPSDVEVDTLGEANVLDRAAQYATQEQEQEQEQESEQEGNAGVDTDAFIEEEIARRVEEALKSRLGQIGSVPTSAATAPPQLVLTARPVMIEHTDHLWDWLRTDTAGLHRFFGVNFPNTMALHNLIRALQDAEANGVGLIRAVQVESGPSVPIQHIGFVMLNPIMSDEKLAVAHIYLRPDARGRLQQLLPPLLQLANQEMPDYKIGVVPGDAAQRRLYESLLLPLGFSAHTILVR